MNKKTVVFALPVLCWPGLLLATENDDAFQDYINEVICDSPEGNLIITCEAATNTTGGSGETLPQIGNTGMQGASEISAREQVSALGGELSKAFENWAVFSTVEHHNIDRDQTNLENGFGGDAFTLTAGADYLLNQRWLLGGSLSKKEAKVDMNGQTGDLETESLEWILFVDYRVSDSLSVDGYLGRVNQNSESTRAVEFGLIQYDAMADYDSTNEQWGVGVNYAFHQDQWSFSSSLSAQYNELTVDAYSEQGGDSIENLNLQFDEQVIESNKITLGLQSGYTQSLKQGVLIPYGNLELIYEMENDQRRIDSRLVVAPDAEAFTIVTDAADEFYGRIGAGIQYILPGGIMLFGDASGLVAHDYFSTWKVAAGFRLEL